MALALSPPVLIIEPLIWMRLTAHNTGKRYDVEATFSLVSMADM